MQWTDRIRQVKILLVLAAIFIAVASLLISHSLIRDLAQQERSKMEVWAEAMRTLSEADDNADLSLVLKVLDENNDEKQEEKFSVRFTQDESAKLQIDVSRDVIKEFNDTIVKEKDSVALPIIEEIKTIDEKQKIIENEKKEELEVEKFAYELSINTISRQAKKKESMVVTPETFAKKIKPKLEIKIAPKLNQATPERELLFSKDTDRGFGRSGLYIEENGNTKPFGQKAGKEEIKSSIESIVKLIENYRKYVIDYNDNYGSRIVEIILYAFTSPFLQDIRFKLESDSEKLDVPQFLFIGGTAGSGKVTYCRFYKKCWVFLNQSLFCTITLFRLEEQKKQIR